MAKKRVNHYKWLEKHFPAFVEKLGIDFSSVAGIITAHGDKCYGYEGLFERHGVPFPHGAAIFLLTYIAPYSKQVRQTASGWVPFEKWFEENKGKFLPLLPPIDANDPDVLSLW